MSETPPSSTDPTPSRGTPLADPLSTIPPSLTPQPGLRSNPQVIAAIITGIISLVVAIVGILPALLKDDDDPTPTVAAALVITLTPTDMPAAAAPTSAPTEQSGSSAPNIQSLNAATATPLPNPGETAVAVSTIASDAEANVRIFFDSASFTIHNLGGGRKTLAGVEFSGDGGQWRASQWGLIHEELTNKDCLRLRDQSASPRNPPADCQTLLALMEVGPAAIFWRGDQFMVERGGATLAVCTVSPCDFYLPRE